MPRLCPGLQRAQQQPHRVGARGHAFRVDHHTGVLPQVQRLCRLGQFGDINIETGVAFTGYDVSDTDFSTDVTACLSELGQQWKLLCGHAHHRRLVLCMT